MTDRERISMLLRDLAMLEAGVTSPMLEDAAMAAADAAVERALEAINAAMGRAQERMSRG